MLRLLNMVCVLCVSFLLLGNAHASELAVSGIGKAAIGQDFVATRGEAMRNAKRAAVLEAVKKMNGPAAANDPKVQQAVDQIVVQIGDDKISEKQDSREGSTTFVTKITLRMDEQEFRKQIQDYGIASTTARLFPILIVMDEFYTSQTNQKKPLRELVEYSHDKTATSSSNLQAEESSASVNAASSRSSYAGSANISANRSSAGSFGAAGNGGAVYGGGRSSAAVSASAQERSKNSSDSYNQSASSAKVDAQTFDQQKNVVSYKKLVEYQPQNVGPEKQNYTYAALVEGLKGSDLDLKDNDLFRSKYFNGKAMTLNELQNGPELARYVKAAREEVQADYFMVGNSIIYYSDKVDPSTGQYTCSGAVSLKAYATESNSLLAGTAREESATGSTPDTCRTAVARKMAGFVSKTVSSQILDHWKKRDMYGQEFNITLVSLAGKLPGKVMNLFADALDSMNGIQGKVKERRRTGSLFEAILSFKSDISISREIDKTLAKYPVFMASESKVEGTNIKICLEGACP